MMRHTNYVRDNTAGYSRPKLFPKITDARSADLHLKEYRDLKKEHFVMITLDGASRVIKTHLISIGTLNQSLVHPREVFRPAIIDNAAGIIVGIDVIDHIVITEYDFYSFRENGKI